MQSWKTSMKRAGFSTLALGVLAGCNFADLRPKADIDNDVVTRSVTPVAPDFAIEPASSLPLVQADTVDAFVEKPKIIAPVPDKLIGKSVAPTITAPQIKKAEKGRLLGRITAGLIPRLKKPNTGGMPKSEVQCRAALKRAGVVFKDMSAVGNGNRGGCGIQHPVKISAFAGKIEMKPAATLNCTMALKLSDWVRKDLQPAARLRYATGVKSIGNMSSYSCRKIAGSKRWSEHSYGNAIDIGSITLNRGQKVVVQKQGVFALRSRSLLNEVRADACNRFTTVLGPGYNKAHADHFHFDLMSRRKTSCH